MFFFFFVPAGTEGRSPLQILKETNSPREQRSQVQQCFYSESSD